MIRLDWKEITVLLIGIFSREIVRDIIVKPITKVIERPVKKYLHEHPLNLRPFLHFYNRHEDDLRDCKNCVIPAPN